jgi:NADH/NAD ratio-sensing transcriptional regulator Rex
MQAGEHQFDDRRVFFRVQAERNAAAIVLDADRAIGVQRDLDLLAVAGQRLVGRVVQHLLDDVQRVVGARVHARALLDGLQALEHADRAFGIFGRVV